MMTSRRDSEAPLFRLSRIGATSRLGAIELEADMSRPTGQGLRLTTHCDGSELHLWISEAAWCAWLDPKLVTPSLAQIEERLYPLLASWTLAPLDEWLQAQGLPSLAPATLSRADTPALCWRFTLGSEGWRLPLCLESVPPALLHRWLGALTPNPDRVHELGLQLGWCQLPEEELTATRAGEVLPLLGMGEAPDRFWLHPLGGTQLQLINGQLGRALPGKPFCAPPPGTARLMVEVGKISLDAATLANWAPDLECAVTPHAYPTLLLLRGAERWAEGELLRMDDGWAVRLTTQP
ncbi:translocation protein in type III secretion [Atlantibacter sp.]|uniref:translocation protein in type III secretion n=1 Tax=Atlantibacter sp. TaxID=1903473 RepID=UPI0028AF583B|nr:translocation protein in type III secretion [Atlantibacter sp.]